MSRIAFDPEVIQRLAGILRDTGLTELEMYEGESRLRLVRAPSPVAALTAPSSTQVVVNPAAPAPVSGPSLSGEEPTPPGAVTSPMVGIVYLAPEPGAAPYVTLGQAVTAGQTLLLIEAMKTFNQIKAPRAGIVTQILVAGGAPVEYGQPLLVIA